MVLRLRLQCNDSSWPLVQIEELRQQGLQCVGWYHSHPTFPVWPSAIDVYNQQIQQVAHSHQATNGCATPYIAAIVGPYDQKNVSAQCSMSWFYVENKRSAEFSLDADPEVCLQHMVPKALSTALIEDAKLTVSHITQCAAELIQRYAGYSSRTELRSVRFHLTHLCSTLSMRCLPYSRTGKGLSLIHI